MKSKKIKTQATFLFAILRLLSDDVNLLQRALRCLFFISSVIVLCIIKLNTIAKINNIAFKNSILTLLRLQLLPWLPFQVLRHYTELHFSWGQPGMLSLLCHLSTVLTQNGNKIHGNKVLVIHSNCLSSLVIETTVQ